MREDNMKKLDMAVIGCGDYVLRWESTPIVNSRHIRIKSLFDLDQEKRDSCKAKPVGKWLHLRMIFSQIRMSFWYVYAFHHG
jgi:hypothetical protein